MTRGYETTKGMYLLFIMKMNLGYRLASQGYVHFLAAHTTKCTGYLPQDSLGWYCLPYSIFPSQINETDLELHVSEKKCDHHIIICIMDIDI